MRKLLTAAMIIVIFISLSLETKARYVKGMAVIEMQTQKLLEGVNENRRLPMASTTKILTALVTLEHASLEEKVQIPAVATNIEGSSMYLIEGETLTVEELLYGLMLTSGNDAAMALAYHVGGGDINAFVKIMNDKVSSMGLTDTAFENPSGLDGEEHYTTALELAKITAAALENKKFAEIVATKSKKVAYNNNPGGRNLTNHNKLLNLYDYAVGVKTGFTKKSGRCLVSAAIKDGVTLICVTLGASDDWNIHEQALESGFERVQYLLFANTHEVTVTLAVAGGGTVEAVNANRVEGTFFDMEIDPLAVTTQIKAPSFVYGPKNKGDIAGKICYYYNQSLLAQEDLVLEQGIEVEVKKDLLITRIIKVIRSFFSKLFKRA